MDPLVRRLARGSVAALATLLATVATLSGCSSAGPAHTMGDPAAVSLPSAGGSPEAPASPAPGASVGTPSSGPTTEKVPGGLPRSGPGTLRYASTSGPVLGTAGPVRLFHVAVESNVTMLDPGVAADKIDSVLGDPRSWVGAGTFRLQRVPQNSAAEFTIYLVTSSTTAALCTRGGITGTGGYTSCQYTGHVVLNLDRWYNSIPGYTAARVPLDTYRTYMVNHEVGHQFGHGHERCPATGRPAPVMEQQSLGLHGCAPNPWPFVDGQLYHGPPGRY